MKTYLITESDIDKLKEALAEGDNNWWYMAQVESWAENLVDGEDAYYCECEKKSLNHMCPCIIKGCQV